jgi:hypothetical protein
MVAFDLRNVLNPEEVTEPCHPFGIIKFGAFGSTIMASLRDFCPNPEGVKRL